MQIPVVGSGGDQELEFGATPSGAPAKLFTLQNAHKMRAVISNWGGTLVALEVPDASGVKSDVVLGFDSLEPYLTNAPFFGALIGRYANRLAAGRLMLAGVTHQLPLNEPPNHLHGGPRGFHRVLWQAAALNTAAGQALELSYSSPAGEEGYPGTLSVRVRYTLGDDNTLAIDYEAESDATTVVNLTHHAYFNLAGHDRGSIEGHVLSIAADAYLPTHADQLPTGELAPVNGTPFDFREPRAIGERIGADHPQLAVGGGYDHCFAVRDWDGSLRPVAEAVDPVSGRRLVVSTTEPGLQLYTGNRLTGLGGKGNARYQARSGFCLEAQHFPNSPAEPGFPSTVLHPGGRYRQTTHYSFR